MTIKALQHPLHHHIFLFRPHIVFFFLSLPLLMSLSSTFVVMATVPSLHRVEQNDILTQDSSSQCLFRLISNQAQLEPGLGPVTWTSVALLTLLCLKFCIIKCGSCLGVHHSHIFVDLLSKECEDAHTHDLKIKINK